MDIFVRDVTGKLILQPETREWCKFPYPGHPKGCPNYNVSEKCPSKVKLLREIFDLSKKHLFVVIKFDIGAHARKMKQLHPEWSEKQARCCLYWQNSVRKKLTESCKELLKYPENGNSYTLIPEAMGVNVFRSCQVFGLKLQKNPQEILHKVALVGFKKE